MANVLDEQILLAELVERLTESCPTVPPETVAEVVHSLHARFNEAPIREFVPLLVEREARMALSELFV
ncbi:MAG: hypothetical protein NTY24_13895 [Mycobacterium sp.]|jgi:hypothetical protein|nr:hypothetical protein [Mycobacterium sp.]MCX6481429.1 hypothetical protein [Mycobacterium sp.]